MIVDNYRLPTGVEEGAVCTPTFKTIVTPSDSGIEARVSVRTAVIWKFQLGYGVTDATWPAVRDSMLLSMGQANPFAFRNWANYQAVDSSIGTGDGTNLTFPLTVTTTSASLALATSTAAALSRTFTERIYLPEDSTLSIKVNGVTNANWTLQDDGIVQFNAGSAPPNGQSVTTTFNFLTPVVWDSDDTVGLTLASPTGARVNNAKLRQYIVTYIAGTLDFSDPRNSNLIVLGIP